MTEQLNSNQYEIITPNEKKGLQLLTLLSKKDRSPEDIEKIKELTPPGQEYVIHLDVGDRIKEPGFFLYYPGISEAIQRRIQEVNNLLGPGTIPTTTQHLEHTDENKKDKMKLEDKHPELFSYLGRGRPVSTPSQKNLGESTFRSIKEEIQLVPQEANKSPTLKEVNNLSQMPYQETISTTMRDLDHMAEELVFLAHSIHVYSPNEMKKKLIQQSKNIQKTVAILNQKFTNQRNT